METQIPSKRRQGLRIRTLFILTFVASALLPAAFLAFWVINSQTNREIETTRHKQIALARTLALALDHFAGDRMTVFRQCADAYFNHSMSEAGILMAQKSNFLYFVALENDGGRIVPFSGSSKNAARIRFNEKIYGYSKETRVFDIRRPQDINAGSGAPGVNFRTTPRPASLELESFLRSHATVTAQFLPVTLDHNGKPVIFVVQRGADGRIIAGALDTAPIATMQTQVSFGVHGHAVVVDQMGNTLGHPKKEWESSIRSLAGVLPVRNVISGETGTVKFYAPARGEDAIAGYTATEKAGWGVLMVRPLAEINDLALENASIAIVVICVGAAVACVIAWFMAGIIVHPVERAAAAAKSLSEGRLSARVSPVAPMPQELSELGTTLNQLAERIDNWRRTANETLSNIRAADQAKRDFMATLSHEIRTPLNAIIGFGELVAMNKGVSPADLRNKEYAENIVTAGRHLLYLIDDILDLAAIEAGQFSLETSAVNVRSAVDEALTLLGPSVSSQDVTIQVLIPGNLPLVSADPHKLRQVILNLIGNAVKFTRAGGQVTVSASTGKDGTVSLSISDTGIGMTQEELRVALAPFGRVANAQNREKKGTGLGLPLAQRLIETMRGELVVTSQPGKGTAVAISLPLASG